MNGFGKALVLTLLVTGCFWLHFHSPKATTETYVFKSGSINLQLERPSSSLFAQQMEDSIGVERTNSTKLKNPNMAIFYAVVPGFLVHGAGHFYAGEKTTGWMLVAGEVLSLGMMTYAVGAGFAEAMGGSDSSNDDDMIGIAGAILFISTWVYDLAGSPVAVQKRNRKILEKKEKGFELDLNQRDNFVGFLIIKRF